MNTASWTVNILIYDWSCVSPSLIVLFNWCGANLMFYSYYLTRRRVSSIRILSLLIIHQLQQQNSCRYKVARVFPRLFSQYMSVQYVYVIYVIMLENRSKVNKASSENIKRSKDLEQKLHMTAKHHFRAFISILICVFRSFLFNTIRFWQFFLLSD